MFRLGENNEIIGGFFGPIQLRGYYYHGPDGSLLKFGEFQNLDSIDPPDFSTTTTLPPTNIGTVTVAGTTTPTSGATATYSVTNDGDASNLSYAWSIVGGTGSSTTASCPVTWGASGPGQVTCTITSTDPLVADSPASDTLNVTIQAIPTPNEPTNVNIVTSDYTPPTTQPPTTQPPTTTPAPGAGITPVNDNKARFYVPASATSFSVGAMSSTGFVKLTDGTNTSPIVGDPYYTNGSYQYMYINSATLSTLVAGDRIIELVPCDAAGTYDPAGHIQGIELTSAPNTVGPTGVDISYLDQLEYFGAMSNGATTYVRLGFNYGGVGNTAPSITEIRAVGVSLGTASQVQGSYYLGPSTYGNGYYWGGGGADLGGQLLDATALDQFYTDLDTAGAGGLIVVDNPGVSSDTPSIATGKGYTVFG